MSITAMKQALEALSDPWSAGPEGVADAITSLRQAIKQAEKQEPVAWTSDVEFDRETEIIPANQKGRLGTFTLNIPLYTAPQPQREWVGLTQQDIDIVFDDTQEGGGFNEFAEAIEAKLKQKNGYAEEKNT